MDIYLLIAGILCFLLGIAHSILGEYLIFKDKRIKGSIVPSKKSGDLKEFHLRIIWATWHLASLFGWCIGSILIYISLNSEIVNAHFTDFIVRMIVYTMFVSSFLVLIGTKGKHPGWIVLLLIGIISIIGKL